MVRVSQAPNSDENAETSDLRFLLGAEHERLHELLDDVLEVLRSGGTDAAVRLWSAFERGLSRHMDLEERLIFPALTGADPAEARALLAEHVDIRRMATELGIRDDPRRASSEKLGEFVRALRAHSTREKALAYPWAEANLQAESRDDILVRLLETARSRRKRG